LDNIEQGFSLQQLNLQPIFDLSTNKVFGYEMLLRSEKVKGPEQIFQYVQEQNKLFDLDMFSIQKAFKTINTELSVLDGVHFFINILPSTIAKAQINIKT
jgi:EAL domain-containing protein (putative c-di-GMP-specific phosphodiesterase class I)